MFKLTTTIGGREIRIDRLTDELQAEVTRVARGEIVARARAAVASLRCPEHGPAVRDITVDYAGGTEGAIKATPCCDAMDAEVGRTIEAAFADE